METMIYNNFEGVPLDPWPPHSLKNMLPVYTCKLLELRFSNDLLVERLAMERPRGSVFLLHKRDGQECYVQRLNGAIPTCNIFLVYSLHG